MLKPLAREVNMTKHRYFLIITLVFTMIVTSCSGSDTQTQTENTTVETTQDTVSSSVSFGTQSAERERELTESEKQALLDEMPEIVFVMSQHFDDTNIYGFYVLKNGEIKMYDFRKQFPNEVYSIPQIYDKLQEATCEKIEPSEGSIAWYENKILYSEDLSKINVEELIKCYSILQKIEKNAKKEYNEITIDNSPNYMYYGIKRHNNTIDIITLSGGGNDYRYKSIDANAEELVNELSSWFPNIPIYK